MGKSILILLIVGAIVVGSVFTSQNAAADHDADFAALANIVGILFNGINSGFASVATQIGAVQTDVVANTAAISAIGPHTTGVPIGTVLSWAGFIPTKADPILPPGFLLADGSSLLRTDFPALFSVIGTIYGEGADRLRETTFSLPDLRN